MVNGYTRYLRPDPRELALLAAVMPVRPSAFEVWAFAADRKTVTDAARAVAGIRAQADALAARATDAFGALSGFFVTGRGACRRIPSPLPGLTARSLTAASRCPRTRARGPG